MGMLAGLGFTLVYIFLHKGWFFTVRCFPGTNNVVSRATAEETALASGV
jgi:hypothetical protein